MSKNTKIEWASHTFNPWMGCAWAHTGCDNCYAARQAARLGVVWGPNGMRVRTSEAYWKQPLKWDRQAFGSESPVITFPSLCDPFEDWPGEIRDSCDNVLHRCPAGHMAYWDAVVPHGIICSDCEETSENVARPLTMSDVLRDFVDLIGRTPNLTWCLATKRPQNARRMIEETTDRLGWSEPYLDNVWLLYSASDQESLEAGLPHLLACRDLSPVIGLSLEPLVGPVVMLQKTLKQLDWVIIGGESGPKARPCNTEWIRDIVRQCASAGVACFMKQVGSSPHCTIGTGQRHPDWIAWMDEVKHPKGGDPTEWPENLRVQQYPEVSA